MGEIKMSIWKNILKMFVGLVVLVIGIIWYTGPQVVVGSYVLLGWYGELISFLKATVGIFLLFAGLIITWMGFDDYKMDKEIVKEEEAK